MSEIGDLNFTNDPTVTVENSNELTSSSVQERKQSAVGMNDNSKELKVPALSNNVLAVLPKKKSLTSMVDCAASLRASAAAAMKNSKYKSSNTMSNKVNTNIPNMLQHPTLPYTLQQQVHRAALSLHGVTVPLVSAQGANTMLAAANSAAVALGSPHNTVAEFLYQLTKMLTDDNREIIEWSNGRIEVHDPPRLASDVLHRYFRHSKYASFQRQLNYFGFRKLAGKGKMSPCSYVNEETTDDLRSLLTIKRKTSASKAAAAQKRLESGKPKPMINHLHHAPKFPLKSLGGIRPSVHPAMGFINETNKRIKLQENPAQPINFSQDIKTNNPIQQSNESGIDNVFSDPKSFSEQTMNNDIFGNELSHSNQDESQQQSSKPSMPTVSSTNSLLAGLLSSGPSSNNLLAGIPSVTSIANFLEVQGDGLFNDNDIKHANVSSSSLSESAANDSLAEENTTRASNNVSIKFRGIGKSSDSNMITRDSSLVDLAMLPLGNDSTETSSSTTMGFIDFPQGPLDDDGGFQ